MEKPDSEAPTAKRSSMKGVPLEKIDIPPLDVGGGAGAGGAPVIARKESKGAGLSIAISPKHATEDADPKDPKKKEKDPLKLADGEKEVNIKGRGLILTEDKEGYEFTYDMLTGLRATCSRDHSLRNASIKWSDYEHFRDIRFPSKGSALTPPHMQRDFKFADYAPAVFARIRDKFAIDPADYLDSLTKEYNLSCVRSPGKSASVFYYSNDGRFMVKTINKSECHYLQAILPSYYEHVNKNPDTLLTRFLGLHRVKPHKDRKAYIVVMQNVLYSPYFDIDELYDLKGSTVGRTAAAGPKKKGVVYQTFSALLSLHHFISLARLALYKDLDFTRGFQLGPAKAKIFLDQLTADAKWLEGENIMDYSLLLGVHELTEMDLHEDPSRPGGVAATPRVLEKQRSFASPTIAYKSIFSHDWGGCRATDATNQPLDVIYFMGIIDILQPYDLTKMLEHGLKSLKYDSDKISAVNASAYAQRFLTYMREQIKSGTAASKKAKPWNTFHLDRETTPKPSPKPSPAPSPRGSISNAKYTPIPKPTSPGRGSTSPPVNPTNRLLLSSGDSPSTRNLNHNTGLMNSSGSAGISDSQKDVVVSVTLHIPAAGDSSAARAGHAGTGHQTTQTGDSAASTSPPASNPNTTTTATATTSNSALNTSTSAKSPKAKRERKERKEKVADEKAYASTPAASVSSTTITTTITTTSSVINTSSSAATNGSGSVVKVDPMAPPLINNNSSTSNKDTASSATPEPERRNKKEKEKKRESVRGATSSAGGGK